QQMARRNPAGDAELRQLVNTLTEVDEADEKDVSGDVEVRQAEIQLRKAQARYRALVEQIPAVTFMAPLDGTVSELYVSPQVEQLLGFTAHQWLNNPIL